MKKNIILIALLLCNSLWSQIKLYDRSIDSIITNTISPNIKFNIDRKKSYVKFEDIDENSNIKSKDIEISLSDEDRINDFIKNNNDYVYRVFFDYKFSFDGVVFYECIFRDNVNNHEDGFIKSIVNDINTICLKFIKKKYILPQQAIDIAMKKGFDTITYQSFDYRYRIVRNHRIKTIDKIVWVLKGESSKKYKTIVINPKNGKILAVYL